MIPKVASAASGRMSETTIAARRLPRNSTSRTTTSTMASMQHLLHGPDGFADQFAAVVENLDPCALRQARLELDEPRLDASTTVRASAPRRPSTSPQTASPSPVAGDDAVARQRAVAHFRHVADAHDARSGARRSRRIRMSSSVRSRPSARTSKASSPSRTRPAPSLRLLLASAAAAWRR